MRAGEGGKDEAWYHMYHTSTIAVCGEMGSGDLHTAGHVEELFYD